MPNNLAQLLKSISYTVHLLWDIFTKSFPFCTLEYALSLCFLHHSCEYSFPQKDLGDLYYFLIRSVYYQTLWASAVAEVISHTLWTSLVPTFSDLHKLCWKQVSHRASLFIPYVQTWGAVRMWHARKIMKIKLCFLIILHSILFHC